MIADHISPPEFIRARRLFAAINNWNTGDTVAVSRHTARNCSRPRRLYVGRAGSSRTGQELTAKARPARAQLQLRHNPLDLVNVWKGKSVLSFSDRVRVC
jgi:hypothetical protein